MSINGNEELRQTEQDAENRLWGGIEELPDREALFCADPDDHG